MFRIFPRNLRDRSSRYRRQCRLAGNIYKISDSERAGIRNKRIGFVFQFYHLLPEFSSLENVILPSLIRSARSSREDLTDRAKAALRSVGLRDRFDHKPGELSGGEAQRVAIARSIINDPEILLCDEPTGNLDSKTSQSILELLFELQTSRKMTLVIVTHDENICRSVKEVVRLKDGKLA